MPFTAIRDTLQDVRYAWRQLRRAPGFTTVAVLTLALGIGANTAFFALVNALAFPPSPVANVAGVVRVGQPYWYPGAGVPLGDFRVLDARAPDSVKSVAAYLAPVGVTLQTPGRAKRVATALVSGGYARVLDLPAQAGRWLSDDDDATVPTPSVVISDRLWHEWFGADRAIIGATSIRVNLTPFTVIGVAPPKFTGLEADWVGIDVWMPLRYLTSITSADPARIDAVGVAVLARAKPGVPSARIETEIGTTLAASRPAPGKATPMNVFPLQAGRSPEVAFAGLAAIGISMMILIAACANLANMLLARGAQRRSELAVRRAIGASSARVLRLLLAETAIIATLAAGAGLAIALATLRLFDGAAPGFGALSRGVVDLSPDYRVFAYAFAAGALATIVLGVGTAWRASRVPPLQALASAGAPSGLTARGGRLRQSLVAVQVTVAVLFVMGAGLVWEQYKKDRDRTGPPVIERYDVDRLATARIDLRLLKYNETQNHALIERVFERVRSLPGVEHAAITDGLPTADYTNLTPDDPAGGRVGSPRLTRVWYSRTSPGFLATLGVRLLRGRDFTTFDVSGAPRVAIVSESAAADLAPGGDVIGTRVKFGPWEWLTIVGVMADPVGSADRGPMRPANVMWLPFAQWPQSAVIVVARTATPAAFLAPLRAAITAVDENIPVFAVSTLRDELRAKVGVARAMNVIMISQSAIALGIAMLGVYGVVAYFVGTRTREFGIRLALGATPGRVVKLVVDHTIHIVLVGLLPGVLIASLSSRLIQSRLFDILPSDIPTWFEVPVIVLVAGLVAGYIPARRAARVDPNVALREL